MNVTLASGEVISRQNKHETLTTKDFAERIGMSLRTVQLYCEDGTIEYGRTPGKHRRIHIRELNKFNKNTINGSKVYIDQIMTQFNITEDDVQNIITNFKL